MRRLRRTLLAVVLAVSATLLVPSGAAQAEEDPSQIYPLYSPIVMWEGEQPVIVGGTHTFVDVPELEKYVEFKWGATDAYTPWPEPPLPDPVPWPWPWPWPGCLSCPPHWVSILEPGLDPEFQAEFLDVFHQAHGRLITSMLIEAEDPDAAQEFRNEAAELYLVAAEMAQGTEIALYGVGWIDEETGVAYLNEDGEAQEFGELIASGAQLSIEALEDPEAVEGALEAFEAAFATTLNV
jgi:hypothetical protein